ncbi:MAG TPA: carotenoid oxygenase family protein, partial [Streptosporangiaceae bacterium]|nr:carotenoid oxygenase family protein [Streptosporangiaceae bacterium]
MGGASAWIAGSYQSDFARNYAREGLDISDMVAEAVAGTLEAAGRRGPDLRDAEHRRQPHHRRQLRRHPGGLTMVDVEVYGKMLSTLPEDDDHPYRSGPWRPQSIEYDATDLQVTGELPGDLFGVYLRNTENPLHPAIVRYHPFDGDAMIHKVSFRDGKVSYRN